MTTDETLQYILMHLFKQAQIVLSIARYKCVWIYPKNYTIFLLTESFNQMKKSGYWCHTCLPKPLVHWFWWSFGHKLSHLVTNCPWPTIKRNLLQKFLHLINKIRNTIQKLKWMFIWSHIKSFRHNLFQTSYQNLSF